MNALKNCIFILYLFTLFKIPVAVADTDKKNMVFLGDSLTEGYGVEKTDVYTSLLQVRANKENLNWNIINSGISGSTTASAPSRVRWILKSKNKPHLVIIILGANDGLRGHKVKSVYKNLSDSIDILQKEKIEVVLGEVWIPPNYGKEYTEEFKKIFSRLAQEKKIKLMPFLLKDVAGKSNLNLADSIHPNEKGHQIIAEEVYQFLKSYLEKKQ